jgi:hypothetical protein
MLEYDTNPFCYVADSGIHGRGLFARQDIPAGTQIGHYDGRVTRENGMHVLWVDNGSGDEEAWIGYDGVNAQMDGQELYASRDIDMHEEITIDYGEEFSEEP